MKKPANKPTFEQVNVIQCNISDKSYKALIQLKPDTSSHLQGFVNVAKLGCCDAIHNMNGPLCYIQQAHVQGGASGGKRSLGRRLFFVVSPCAWFCLC